MRVSHTVAVIQKWSTIGLTQTDTLDVGIPISVSSPGVCSNPISCVSNPHNYMCDGYEQCDDHYNTERRFPHLPFPCLVGFHDSPPAYPEPRPEY